MYIYSRTNVIGVYLCNTHSGTPCTFNMNNYTYVQLNPCMQLHKYANTGAPCQRKSL